jgi:PAS domain S-box-containing protein
MTPTEWPLRLVPRRSPPVWLALLISVAAIIGAILARGLFLGFDNATGLSVSYFPAFIVATLYAGPRWGWVTLLVALLIGAFGATSVSSQISREALTILYGLSGALTVAVAAGLREALLRLDEAHAAEAKVQADLAATEARFRLLADSAPVLMWVSRPDGRREFANRAYLDFMGVEYAAALEFDWRTILHPDDRVQILAQDAAGGPNTEFVWEARYRRRDGQYRWIRSTSQPRFLATGERSGYIGIGYDISEAKQAEADLKRINDLLAERVQAALSERDEAEAALRRAQKMEAVGQLTGGVAHDFNNLLTVIVGALDMIQRHPSDAARRDRMIEAAQGAARRGERLTQQLLAFSRRQALKPELVRIDDLLAESEPLLSRAVGEAVALTVSPGAPGSVANIDPSQFEAAVMNLVVNARDATPPGGTIRVESFLCSVAIGQVEDVAAGDYLCVTVHDTGVGMDAEVAARVFEPFFTTKGPGRGTGLGLSQVYGFARQSGGGAVVESAPGKGATVRLYLPLAAREAEDRPVAPAVQAAATPAAPTQRVLLVEDDLGVGDMVAAMLGDLGHLVLRADDAAAALEILKRQDPIDLMLTDLIMPGGKNGVELAHEAVAMRPGLPVILTSGYTGETLGAAAEAPWPLLKKPYAAEALAAVIEASTTRTSEKV